MEINESDAVSRTKVGNSTIIIDWDLHAPNPRENFDPVGIMYAETRDADYSDKGAKEKHEKYLKRKKDYIAVPIYAYIHGGITISHKPFSCAWDSSQLGVIFRKKSEIRENFGWKRLTQERVEAIKDLLIGEIRVMDQHLTGEVYGYTILDKNDRVRNSCWGFYSTDAALEEAKEEIRQSSILIRVQVNIDRYAQRTQTNGHQNLHHYDPICDRSGMRSL